MSRNKRYGYLVECSICHAKRGTLRKIPGDDRYLCQNCYLYLTTAPKPVREQIENKLKNKLEGNSNA